MGALFSKPKTPAPPPPPPNPSVAADAGTSLTSTAPKDGAGGTLMTGPGGTPEVKTTGKQLLGQ